MKGSKRFRFGSTLTSLLIVVSLLLPWAVFADNVTNDVVVGGTDTFTLGGSRTLSYKIVATSGSGDQPGCNASDGSAATVTINTPGAVTATPGTLTFNACNVFKSVEFTASATGNYPITVSVSDSGGGSYHTVPAAFTLKVLAPSDTTLPTIVCNVPNQTIWYATDQSVPCTASDPSGLQNPADASFSLSTSVAGGTESASAQTNSKTVCDTLNNCALAGPYTFKIDKKAPTITITTPSGGATYTLNQAVAANYSCDDGGSGVALCSGPVANGSNIDTGLVGLDTFAVNATDNVGNASQKSVSYSVIYNWNGFFRPVDNLPMVNVAKAGSAIPVKFSLSGNQGLNIMAANYPKVKVIPCDSNAVTDSIEETVTAGGSSLSYDPSADQYVYVWKTDKAWTGCRQLVVKLNDGMEYQANFKFTK